MGRKRSYLLGYQASAALAVSVQMARLGISGAGCLKTLAQPGVEVWWAWFRFDGFDAALNQCSVWLRRWLPTLNSVIFHGIEGFNLHRTNDSHMRRRGVLEMRARKMSIGVPDAKAMHMLSRN